MKRKFIAAAVVSVAVALCLLIPITAAAGKAAKAPDPKPDVEAKISAIESIADKSERKAAYLELINSEEYKLYAAKENKKSREAAEKVEKIREEIEAGSEKKNIKQEFKAALEKEGIIKHEGSQLCDVAKTVDLSAFDLSAVDNVEVVSVPVGYFTGKAEYAPKTTVIVDGEAIAEIASVIGRLKGGDPVDPALYGLPAYRINLRCGEDDVLRVLINDDGTFECSEFVYSLRNGSADLAVYTAEAGTDVTSLFPLLDGIIS